MRYLDFLCIMISSDSNETNVKFLTSLSSLSVVLAMWNFAQVITTTVSSSWWDFKVTSWNWWRHIDDVTLLHYVPDLGMLLLRPLEWKEGKADYKLCGVNDTKAPHKYWPKMLGLVGSKPSNSGRVARHLVTLKQLTVPHLLDSLFISITSDFFVPRLFFLQISRWIVSSLVCLFVCLFVSVLFASTLSLVIVL